MCVYLTLYTGPISHFLSYFVLFILWLEYILIFGPEPNSVMCFWTIYVKNNYWTVSLTCFIVWVFLYDDPGFLLSIHVVYPLKMDYNENSHIKLTIEPCLCCVQVTIYGHVFLFIILLQFDRQNETPLLRFLKFPALHWFPTKTHWKSTMKSTI